MGVWIRSQGRKRIINTDCIEYSYWNGHHRILDDTGEIIGSYKTAERAMAVLEDIQDHIRRTVINAENYTNKSIYQMPRE